jgi:class 3 adenylate cyclase
VTEFSDIRYARTADGLHIAYRFSPKRSVDLLEVSTFVNSIAVEMEHPEIQRMWRGIQSYARNIWYDRRGVGLSDPPGAATPPTLEHWVEDAVAVLDDLAVRRAVVFAQEQVSGFIAMLLAAMHPGRVSSLVLLNTCARLAWAADYPFGLSQEAQARFEERIERCWPDVLLVEAMAPSMAEDEAFKREWHLSLTIGGSPATAVALTRVIFESDVRSALASIQAPTLILHTEGNRMVPVQHGRYLASHIAGAKYVELPGADQLLTGQTADQAAEEIKEFITGERMFESTDRVLATILFTDIAGSTTQVTSLGDRRWRQLLDAYETTIGRQLVRYRGHQVKTTGDGALVTFDGPARAIQCACVIRDAARQLGMEVRTGLHTGEIEVRKADVSGIAVHVAQRVQSLAQPGEVLVSRTVADLVDGSGIEFDDRGEHELRGVPGSWKLFAVKG